MDKKSIIGCSIGNIFEWYDFMVYGALAPILSALFFPKENQVVAIMLILAIFASGYVIRPIGGIFFGHIGDKYGRKKSMILSIMLIGFPSLAMLILPVYSSIGILAPTILLILRLIQGFSIGGELPSLVAYFAESAPKEKRGFYTSFTNIIPAIGILLAMAVIATLNQVVSHENIMLWAWRIPFLISIVLISIGFYLRISLLETPVYQALTDKINNPLKYVFKHEKLSMFKIFLFGIFIAIPYYTFNVFAVSYFTTFLHLSYKIALNITLFGTIAYTIMIPFLGKLLDIWGRKTICVIAGISLIILIYPVYLLLNTKVIIWMLTGQIIFAFFLAAYLAASSSFLSEQVHTKARCTALGLPYNLALAIFGGTTPLINALLIKHTGMSMAPAFYIVFAAVIGVLVTITMIDKTKKEL